ncbi:Amidohydro-rel domain-containing protein [Paraburkholderia tropica]|uniref:amidohydrolase family protein n=1 Tax=Paraburkholderia tropica TaxID=92647 RepID=UPI001CADC0AE|nr:amidohydrolase family protein [Paraburkholderia tropica]CAG9238684.1 Amidohydro-rel domain-containing protein [Paraburkholderia tropica]
MIEQEALRPGAVPFSAGTATARVAAPDLACDCHMHVYSPRFAVAADAQLKPPAASLQDYRSLQRRLGTTRNVFVQPSTYGNDNACVLDAIASAGTSARGIAVASGPVRETHLDALDAGGIVGLRFNLVRSGKDALRDAVSFAPALAERGWHLEIHVGGAQLPEIAPTLARMPCDVTIDHFGRLRFNEGPSQPALRSLCALLDNGRAWVKLSGAYHDTDATRDSIVQIGRALVEHRADRLVWGSDWPHPAARSLPDDAEQFDYLLEWTRDEATRHQILVDNAARLYRF